MKEKTRSREYRKDGIVSYSYDSFTKEEFIRMIESNFPDEEGYGYIVVGLTVESGVAIHQSFTFGKVLDFYK